MSAQTCAANALADKRSVQGLTNTLDLKGNNRRTMLGQEFSPAFAPGDV
jgi:hypothetical protein